MLSLGVQDSRLRNPDRSLQDCLGARGLHSIGALACTFRSRAGPSWSKLVASARGSRAHSSHRLPVDRGHELKVDAPNTRRSGPLRRCPTSVALPTTPLTKSRTRCDIRGQNPSAGFTGSGASGPAHQPLKPDAFTAKKPSVGGPGGGRSKPTELLQLGFCN